MEKAYDICVVGAGLWGSAAARHVSAQSGLKVCLLGPTEPPPEDYGISPVLGSHYDSGRIYRSPNEDTIWRTLTHRSINEYANLETLSGIKFHQERDSLLMGPANQSYVRDNARSARTLSYPFQICSSKQLKQRFPYLSMDHDYQGVLSFKGSGVIDPRKMILAEQTVARIQGCDIIDDTAIRIQTMDHSHVNIVQIRTAKNVIICAKKVLLCTGAFINFHDLLPKDMKLDLTVYTEQIVFAEVKDQELKKIMDLPTIISHAFRKPDYDDFYLLPPLKYPNGKYYMKIGVAKDFTSPLHSLDDIRSWFKNGGDPEIGRYLLQLMYKHIDFKPASVQNGGAVTCRTKHGYPYCGMLSPNVGVCVGGCGHGAKASEEIGRMGAKMILKGQWDYDLPQEKFRPLFQGATSRL